jgi:hypothetical protein
MDETQEFNRMADDPELVVSVEFDRGYHASIGDRAHGYCSRIKVPTFEAAVWWLKQQAQVLYPSSHYAKELRDRVMARQGRPAAFLYSRPLTH